MVQSKAGLCRRFTPRRMGKERQIQLGRIECQRTNGAIAIHLRSTKTLFANEREGHEWVEPHAVRIVRRFEQWQKPLGIGSNEYFKYLTKQLIDCCDNSLWKSLFESVS